MTFKEIPENRCFLTVFELGENYVDVGLCVKIEPFCHEEEVGGPGGVSYDDGEVNAIWLYASEFWPHHCGQYGTFKGQDVVYPVDADLLGHFFAGLAWTVVDKAYPAEKALAMKAGTLRQQAENGLANLRREATTAPSSSERSTPEP